MSTVVWKQVCGNFIIVFSVKLVGAHSLFLNVYIASIGLHQFSCMLGSWRRTAATIQFQLRPLSTISEDYVSATRFWRVKQHLHVWVDTHLRLYFILHAVRCRNCNNEVPDGLVISTEHQCKSVKRECGRTFVVRWTQCIVWHTGRMPLSNGAVPLHYSPTDRIMESFSRCSGAACRPNANA